MDQRQCRVATIEQMPGQSEHEREANAALIANAPAMLEALKEIKSRCEGCVEGGFRADPAAFIKIAGNAIAEVEGGEA